MRSFVSRPAAALSVVLLFSGISFVHGASSVEDRLKALEERQSELEREILDRDARIKKLSAPAAAAAPEDSEHIGRYTPGKGFQVADTEYGDLSVRLFTYVRYLNQRGLDGQYTDASGQTSVIQQRQDIQLNKVTMYLAGWLMDPKFRYLLYVWTNNTAQGQGAQVVVAGNLNYAFNEHFTLGGGVDSLPGVRTTEGNFPFWLSVDNRLISDEFFRPSYTMGIMANGNIVKGLDYHMMLGNNLSQLGVDAGQLNSRLDTFSSALVWMPMGDYGKPFGDFNRHEATVTRFGAHFTRSDENYQAQPNTDAFENVQIRISDGRSIFTPDLFGTGSRVTDAQYQMTSFDAGLKWNGFSLEGEYYWRWVNDFRGTSVSAIPALHDNGFQLQGSAMVIPKTLQAYVSGSKVFGEYGNPWDTRIGATWFPWNNQVVRLNLEYLYLYHSPVGGASLPYPVGGTGPIIYTNFMVNF